MRRPTDSPLDHRSAGGSSASIHDGRCGRTNTRHTAHRRDYPKQITVLRARHPFEGRVLETLAWIHRRGDLYANAILPDGTRAMIPAAWTDYAAQQSAEQPCVDHPAATLASISQLLHARTVV